MRVSGAQLLDVSACLLGKLGLLVGVDEPFGSDRANHGCLTRGTDFRPLLLRNRVLIGHIDEFLEKVCRIGGIWAAISQTLKVVQGLVTVTKETEFTLTHNHELVKEIEQLDGRLLQSANDRRTHIGDDANTLKDIDGSLGIQTSAGLIKKIETRTFGEFNTDGDTFLLTTRDTTQEIVTDNSIAAMRKAKQFKHSVYTLLDLVLRGVLRHLATRSKLERLTDRIGRHVDIILSHVAHQTMKLAWIRLLCIIEKTSL
mmetsp:Transcript_1334/g.3171  ORF Transcript_1334/g.3171 Transcript_1334/m.3171 type:complete len:257 (-) Transcript_1334:846-1616(-)